MGREVTQNAIEVPNAVEQEYPVPPMAEMHKFIIDAEAEKMLPDDMLKRIRRRKKECQDTFNIGYWASQETIGEVKSMISRGYYPKGTSPKEHREKMNAIFASPEGHHWTVGDDKEELDRDDILVTGGIIAANVLTPDEFWADLPGFSGPSDVQGTVGALLMRNRDLFLELGGYEWETKVNDQVTHQTRITGSMHGDLRIERICVSPKKTIDPFDKEVHYRPLTRNDRERIATFHSTETLLLAAVLKYIDQEKIAVECLKDNGAELVQGVRNKGLRAGNFADFGANESPAQLYMTQFPYPMQQATEGRIFWHLGMEYNDASYRIHIDERRHLAFTMMDKHGVLHEKPSLTLPPEEMDQLIRGIFVQAQQGRGRTSVPQLEAILKYRFSERFKTDMEK